MKQPEKPRRMTPTEAAAKASRILGLTMKLMRDNPGMRIREAEIRAEQELWEAENPHMKDVTHVTPQADGSTLIQRRDGTASKILKVTNAQHEYVHSLAAARGVKPVHILADALAAHGETVFVDDARLGIKGHFKVVDNPEDKPKGGKNTNKRGR